MANKKIIKIKKTRSQIHFLCRLAGGLFLSSLLLMLPFIPVTAWAEGPALWDGTAAGGFAGGTGTESDPYLISNGKELKFFSNQVNAGTTYAGQYIKLSNDILLNEMNANGTFVSGSPREFTAIGSESKPFQGNFDGADKEIIGIYIKRNWVANQGLFGYAGTESEIKNVKVLGSIEGGEKSGAIAGYTDGLITNCIAHCPVTAAGRDYHGGIVGYADLNSVISNCTAAGAVGGSNYIGGIAGCLKGKIIACESSGDLNGTGHLGGIAGSAAGTASEISNCSFLGTVTGSSNCVGGIAGQTEGLINGCFVDAVITGKSGTIGGITGYAKGGGSIISNCSVSGTVEAIAGYGNVGGVAGEADGKITGCTCTCTVMGKDQHLVGGVVGSAGTGSEISNSSSSGDVTGKGKVGGIAGYTDGEITICINTGNVNGNSGHIGGVAGEAGDNSTVSNSYNAGDVQGSGQGGIGGIVGHAGSGTVVHHNLNKGAVGGSDPMGSVIGEGIDPDNAWNNYYYDYGGAPGGASDDDIEANDGAVSVGGDPDWEDVWEDLNEDNPGEDGNPIWNQDMDDEGVPKPGGDGEGTGPGGAFKVQRSVIKEGKHFETTILEDTGAAVVTVTADSVFTAAFSLKYDEDSSPGEHRLRLKNEISGEPLEFPAGTSVIMLTDGSYYYLNLSGSTAGATEITLKNLIKMGSTAQAADAAECYHPALVAKDAEKDFLFILDFSGAAVSEQAEGLSYKVELTNSAGEYGGAAPLVNITGKNNYGLSVSGAGSGDNTFTFSFTGPGPVVSDYDYKTDGKRLAFEFYLEKAGASGRIPLPAGTKISQSGNFAGLVTAARPYAFLPEGFTAPAPLSLVVNLDQAGCAVPLAAGNYRLAATAYAFADSLDFINPRGGTVLAESGPQEISLAAPVAYAIRASAPARAFDLPDDPAEKIAVTFTVQARGSNNVKVTLQRKYGQTYVDVAGEKNKFVGPDQGSGNFTGSGGSATLPLPTGTAKGTYRFLFTLYDENGVQEKARTVKNIIVK